MTPTTHTQSKGPVAGVIAGAAMMLVAVAVLAAGAGALWADSHRGHDGTLSWKPKPGHWDVVVMNADGTPSVDAAVSLGAQTPPLLVPGLALVALGIMVGVGGFALVY